LEGKWGLLRSGHYSRRRGAHGRGSVAGREDVQCGTCLVRILLDEILDHEGDGVGGLLDEQVLDDGDEERVDVLGVEILLQLRLHLGGLWKEGRKMVTMAKAYGLVEIYKYTYLYLHYINLSIIYIYLYIY
jgi:hypothetical protein